MTIGIKKQSTAGPTVRSQHVSPSPAPSLPPPPPPPLPPSLLYPEHKETFAYAQHVISTPISGDSSGGVTVRITAPRTSDILNVLPLQNSLVSFSDTSVPQPRHAVTSGSVVVPTNQEAVLIGGDTVLLLKEIVELREKDVARRIHINNGLRDLKYKSQHVAKAQEDFMKASEAYMLANFSRSGEKNSIHRLQLAWRNLQDLTNVAQSREKQLEETQKGLLDLENRLFMKENEFYARVRGPTREALEAMASSIVPTDDFTTLSTSSGSSASTVSVAHRYYNKVGDLNLLRERLFNFDSEHRRVRIIRDVQRQEGQRLDPPNKIFSQLYFTQREAMIREYVTAKAVMEELRKACDHRGVKVQPPDLPPVLDNSHRVDDSINLYTDHPVKDEYQRHISSLYGHTDSHHRIVRWIREVQRSKHTDAIDSIFVDDDPSPIDNASPPLRAHQMQAWADPPVEDYPALSSYERMHASSTSDASTAETDTPARMEKKRLAATRQNPSLFPGELPARRYSLPSLPSVSTPVARLSNGTLGWKRKGDCEALYDFFITNETSKSLSVLRSGCSL